MNVIKINMEKKPLTPFGIRYEGESCSIKVRYSQQKWKLLGLPEEYNHFTKTTNSGYIIFEISLSINSPHYRKVINRINGVR